MEKEEFSRNFEELWEEVVKTNERFHRCLTDKDRKECEELYLAGKKRERRKPFYSMQQTFYGLGTGEYNINLKKLVESKGFSANQSENSEYFIDQITNTPRFYYSDLRAQYGEYGTGNGYEVEDGEGWVVRDMSKYKHKSLNKKPIKNIEEVFEIFDNFKTK